VIAGVSSRVSIRLGERAHEWERACSGDTDVRRLRQSTETQNWRDQFGNVELRDEWGAKPRRSSYGVGLNRRAWCPSRLVLAHYGVKAA
jgi:hypothetical protein